MTRVPPLPAEQWDDDGVREAVALVCSPHRRNPQGCGNAIATLVQHPDLARAYLPFNVYLTAGSTLPARLRELAILRLAHRADSEYEWTHHEEAGRAVGLSAADIEAARTGETTDALDRLVLAAVDELMTATRISDDTWRGLCAALERRQVMDLVFTVGGYLTLAMGLNSFGVEPESDEWRDAARREAAG